MNPQILVRQGALRTRCHSLRLGLKEWLGRASLAPFPSASALDRSPPWAPPNSWAWPPLLQWRTRRPIEFGGPAADDEATDGDGDGNGSRGTSRDFPWPLLTPTNRNRRLNRQSTMRTRATSRISHWRCFTTSSYDAADYGTQSPRIDNVESQRRQTDSLIGRRPTSAPPTREPNKRSAPLASPTITGQQAGWRVEPASLSGRHEGNR